VLLPFLFLHCSGCSCKLLLRLLLKLLLPDLGLCTLLVRMLLLLLAIAPRRLREPVSLLLLLLLGALLLDPDDAPAVIISQRWVGCDMWRGPLLKLCDKEDN
jgi:hypothetical protein